MHVYFCLSYSSLGPFLSLCACVKPGTCLFSWHLPLTFCVSPGPAHGCSAELGAAVFPVVGRLQPDAFVFVPVQDGASSVPGGFGGRWGGRSGMAETSPEPTSTKTGLCWSPPVPPNIEPGPLNKAVLENASVTLECLASGVPPPGKTPPLGRQPSPATALVPI